ncbi:hypothetical protein B566_EDAN006109 [Ephemera danica]|nr:hypothetical protein B566_EDAN006109 [Ephemera danica]
MKYIISSAQVRETRSFYALLMVEGSQHMLIANCVQATFEMNDPESTTLVGYALIRIEHYLRRNISQPEELMTTMANFSNILLQGEYAGNIEFNPHSC